MMEEIIKLNSMESSSTLFEKAIPVRVTRMPGVEDRLMELTVRIMMGISKHHRSSKVLRMQLTDEADPFFLYFLEVTEDDFQNLKVEQCILVDFTTFPYKFIELLEHCIDAGNHDTPRFQAILHVRTGDSTFSIVEANQFKHLSHLSLCFRQGNDCTIKTYLAGRLAEFKAANNDLHEKLRRTLMSLEMALRDNGNLNSELAEIRENNSRSINQLKTEYTMEIAHEKEKALQEFAQAKESFGKERADLERRLRQQAETHQDRFIELDKQVRELTDCKHTFEVKIAEARTRLATAEKELEEKVKESERLCKENQNLDGEKQESSKLLNQHLVRLGALDQEVQDKHELISSLQKQLEVQTFQRASIELSLKDAQVAADRAEEKYKVNEAELNKCRQSVDKLQAELRTSKAKVKLKGQVASQQDNLLIERQTAIERTVQENNSLKQEIASVKDEKDSFKKKVDELKIKLDEAQELQQSNHQMIQWLNQQLTDAQLGRLSSTSVASRYILKPNLSIFPSADSTCRGATNLVGPSFSASASLNGALSCTTYKSMLRSSSPFAQGTYSKATMSGTSNGGISTVTSKPTAAAAAAPKMSSISNGTVSLHPGYGAVKVYNKPVSHLIPRVDFLGSAGAAPSSTVSALLKPELNAKLSDSAPSVLKGEESSWKLLPRPPLSFVDARCELLSLSTKHQVNSSTRNCLSNGNDLSPKAAVNHVGNSTTAAANILASPTPAQYQSADVS